jgi:hypothetical protein
MPSRLRHTHLLAALTAASALTLGACSGFDGVQLEGKLFDWMGVSSSALSERAREPKMVDRAPLVVPPNVSRLPDPAATPVPDGDIAALKDPDQRKKAAAAERERLHLAYCRGEIQWKDKALNPQAMGANRSPYGPCPGLFSGALDGMTK